MKKILIHLIILIIVSSILRFVFLDRIPIGIGGDELDYVMNAKALVINGSDISKQWNPFILKTPPFEVPKAELPYFLVAPYIGIMPLSLLHARVPYAMYSILFVILMYFLSLEFFKDKNKSFIIGIITAINPWMIYFGRSSYDTPLAIYFYYLALYLILKLKNKKIFFSLIAFAIAFYSYIGTKVIYFPFLLFSTLYAGILAGKKYAKRFLFLFLVGLIPLLYFIATLSTSPVSYRTGDLLTYSSDNISSTVNYQRKLSIYTPITNILESKPVIFSEKLIENYFGVFSTSYLFLYGENSPFISLWFHGIFYYADAVFLLLGFCYLFATNKKLFLFLTAVIAIAPLPSLASTVGSSYSIRSSLMFPIFIIFIGLGIWYTIYFFKNRLIKIIVLIIIIGIYGILLLNFVNIYFFRNPIYSSETFGFSGRLLAKYVSLAKNHNEKIVFIDKISKTTIPYAFKQYIFYTNGFTKNSSNIIAQDIKEDRYSFNDFSVSECPTTISANEIFISGYQTKCAIFSKFSKTLTIPQLGDGGSIYAIYNDQMCNAYKLNRYPSNFRISQFAVEKLSEKDFCTSFITNLNN
ncbi:MAG TPA: hypothetical protein VF820_01950 [Patescibacteria group bacterium]